MWCLCCPCCLLDAGEGPVLCLPHGASSAHCVGAPDAVQTHLPPLHRHTDMVRPGHTAHKCTVISLCQHLTCIELAWEYNGTSE